MTGIVVGFDESARARQALSWAMHEAGIRGAALTVVTVVPAMASPFTGHPLSVPDGDNAIRRARQAAEEEVAESGREIGGPGPVSVTVMASAGFPVQALIDASKDADLVVVGARGAGGFAALLLGSVSSQVAQHAACPVVIVPAAASNE
jgi:nucleotide-binding universal stress UspA family protein